MKKGPSANPEADDTMKSAKWSQSSGANPYINLGPLREVRGGYTGQDQTASVCMWKGEMKFKNKPEVWQHCLVKS